MTVWKAIFLGIVQGVAEFLPISSSGHLSIAQNLLLTSEAVANDNLFFDVLLHLGTLLAIFVAYWSDVKGMVTEFFGGVRDVVRRTTPTPMPPARRLVMLIVMGTLPLVLILPIKDKVESLYSNTWFVGGALIVTGFLLFAADRFTKGKRTEKTARIRDVLLVGCAQAIATVPGISRSGMTITAGCFCGFDRTFAVRYSFLMSIPAVLGANLLTLVDAVQSGIDWSLMPVYLVGVAVAAVSGYLSICLLRFVVKKGKFGSFSYYCWGVGVLTLILTAVRG